MSETAIGTTDSWVPHSCSLPAAEQPLRAAEFDALFREDVQAVRRVSPTRVVLLLRASPDAAGRAAGLGARESACCSFFSFELVIGDGQTTFAVGVPPSQSAALAALATRAEAALGTAHA